MSKKNNYSITTALLSSSLSLLIIFLCSLTIIGCKKKERDHYTIDEEVKKYGLFQEGSYWIYMNHATNLIDCAYIIQAPRFSIQNFSGPEDLPLIDQYHIFFNSPLYNILYLVDNYIYGFYGVNSSWIIYISDVKLYESRDLEYSCYTFVDEYDTLIINGIIFENVIHTRYTNGYGVGSTDSLKNDFFLAPGIGIIKMGKTYPQGDTLRSLLRYHAVQ